MKILPGNYGVILIILLTSIVAFISLLPIYRNWESKKMAEKLRMRLVRERRKQVLKSLSLTNDYQPKGELSTGV